MIDARKHTLDSVKKLTDYSVQYHKSYVMTGISVFITDISQSYNQIFH